MPSARTARAGPDVFDFGSRVLGGVGPLVLRQHTCLGGPRPLAPCTTARNAPDGQCVTLGAVANDPVPLDGLNAADTGYAFVVSEGLLGEDRNGDDDDTDDVVQMVDERTGRAPADRRRSRPAERSCACASRRSRDRPSWPPAIRSRSSSRRRCSTAATRTATATCSTPSCASFASPVAAALDAHRRRHARRRRRAGDQWHAGRGVGRPRVLPHAGSGPRPLHDEGAWASASRASRCRAEPARDARRRSRLTGGSSSSRTTTTTSWMATPTASRRASARTCSSAIGMPMVTDGSTSRVATRHPGERGRAACPCRRRGRLGGRRHRRLHQLLRDARTRRHEPRPGRLRLRSCHRRIERVSVDSNGKEANAGVIDEARALAISGDGRFVAFAEQLVQPRRGRHQRRRRHLRPRPVHPHDGTGQRHDRRRAGRPRLVHPRPVGARHLRGRQAGDVRQRCTHLVADDRNGVRDVFVRDRVRGTTTRVSVGVRGEEANAGSRARPSRRMAAQWRS